MEEFNKFIFHIFEQHGYELRCQILEGQSLYKHKDKDDYWIISDGFWAIENQYKLYEALTKDYKGDFPHADKNTSLLLLIDIEREAEGNEDARFVQMENDPLYFKKYVLPYTKSSFDELKAKLESMKAGSVEDIIMRNEVFEDLKKNEEYAQLLYTIIHKLPFIPISTEGKKDLNDVLFFSLETSPLAISLDTFPNEREQQDAFIENLIMAYENKEN